MFYPDEIFLPGIRHWHEEKDRKHDQVILVADAAPPWGIDLDAGTATVRRGSEPLQHHPAAESGVAGGG